MIGRFASHLEVMDHVYSQEALVMSRKGAAACPRWRIRALAGPAAEEFQLALQEEVYLVSYALCEQRRTNRMFDPVEHMFDPVEQLSPPHLATDVLMKNLVRTVRLLGSATRT